MTSATLKNPGSCRQCGGSQTIRNGDGEILGRCAVCCPDGGVYVVSKEKIIQLLAGAARQAAAVGEIVEGK